MILRWNGTVDQALIEPQFLTDVTALLDRSPFWWVITSGFRSLAEQQVLHEAHLAGGPRAAPPGRSAHNYGFAIDVVLDGDPVKPGLQPDWQPDTGDGWYWLRDAIAPHPRLRHGSHFGDWPHIERVRWAEHRAWLQRVAPTIT